MLQIPAPWNDCQIIALADNINLCRQRHSRCSWSVWDQRLWENASEAKHWCTPDLKSLTSWLSITWNPVFKSISVVCQSAGISFDSTLWQMNKTLSTVLLENTASCSCQEIVWHAIRSTKHHVVYLGFDMFSTNEVWCCLNTWPLCAVIS